MIRYGLLGLMVWGMLVATLTTHAQGVGNRRRKARRHLRRNSRQREPIDFNGSQRVEVRLGNVAAQLQLTLLKR